MMEQPNKTICPYCRTINFVNRQLLYVDDYGMSVYICQLCKKAFTDISIKRTQESEEEKEQVTNLNYE